MSLIRTSLLSSSIAMALASPSSFASRPPTQEELQKYREDGTLDERLRRAHALGHHTPSPSLLRNMQERFRKMQSIPPLPEGAHPAPPKDWQGGLPTSGKPKALVFLVDFPEYPHTASQTVEDVKAKMFGDGDPKDYPYESLRNFYRRSSYGKLDIKGTVLGWYRAKYPRSYYQDIDYMGKPGDGNNVLIKEVLDHYNPSHDFSQYDNDGNGTIDSIFIKWTGPDTGWNGFWWAYQYSFSDTTYKVDGKKPGHYIWSWYENEEADDKKGYYPKADIHETGHLLGLPDYYDYDELIGSSGGIGKLDMMDGDWGDHNCFSKFMLDWISPTTISSGTQTLTLKPSGTSDNAVLIMPKATDEIFGEFFMAQYRKRNTGNDPKDYPADGLLIWHVDARLKTSGRDFEYDNSYTEHKLLRLMEADGLEDIENLPEYFVDAGDFYLSPKIFGPATKPNSNDYSGKATGITIDNIGMPGESISARFSINTTAPVCKATTTVLGKTVNGQWDASCLSKARAGRYAKFYTFAVPTTKSVTLQLNSSAADSYLILRKGAVMSGGLLAYNDNFSTVTKNARITKSLTAGTYTIEATTVKAGVGGAFTLFLR